MWSSRSRHLGSTMPRCSCAGASGPKPRRLAQSQLQQRKKPMNALFRLLNKTGFLQSDIDYYLIRASMVLIFLAFGYQKWFAYEAQVLIPYISNGPLIFWLYPVFGVRGASWFLGVSEWLFGALLFLGFWNKRLGILGAIGSTVTFVMTVTIIPFMPNLHPSFWRTGRILPVASARNPTSSDRADSKSNTLI